MKSPKGNSGALNAYNQVAVQTGVSSATPHRLIQMLLDAALEKIATAKGCMIHQKIAEKGKQIGLAVSIIDALRASLDKDKGGEISTNLDSLYEYMVRQLTSANAQNDVSILDEVMSLLHPIKEAWDAIPEDVKIAHENEQKIQDQKQHDQVATG